MGDGGDWSILERCALSGLCLEFWVLFCRNLFCIFKWLDMSSAYWIFNEDVLLGVNVHLNTANEGLCVSIGVSSQHRHACFFRQHRDDYNTPIPCLFTCYHGSSEEPKLIRVNDERFLSGDCSMLA